jgi:hypothetical protein
MEAKIDKDGASVELNADESEVVRAHTNHGPFTRVLGSNNNTFGEAWTDGEYLYFFHGERARKGLEHEQRRFIYFMGGENDAYLVAMWQGVSVWGGMSEGRLSFGAQRWRDVPEVDRSFDVDPTDYVEYKLKLTDEDEDGEDLE